MNFKDIKKSLKEEQENKRVPDVLSRAKRAPINRLLIGQSPLKAFDKTTTLRLLWTATALLLVAVLAFFAFAFLPAKDSAPSQAYVRIEIEREGDEYIIGFVASNDVVLLCVKETDASGEISQDLYRDGENLEYAINGVYQAKADDKVRVCVFCDDAQDAIDLARMIKESIQNLLADGVEIGVETLINDNRVFEKWASYAGCVGEKDIEDVIDKYLVKFGK